MKILLLLTLFFIIVNCTNKLAIDHHGVHKLYVKQEKIFPNETNKNDILNLLCSPSTKSTFYNDLWIYIERKQTQSQLKNLGKMKIYKNDVLVLEIDDYGILRKKKLYDINDMEKIKVVEDATSTNMQKSSFIYNFMSSMRQKINDPLGQRAKKRKEITQR